MRLKQTPIIDIILSQILLHDHPFPSPILFRKSSIQHITAKRGNDLLGKMLFIFSSIFAEELGVNGEPIGETTNNEAEYRAVIFALSKAKALWGKEKTRKLAVEIYMDSELVMKQLNGEYKVEEEKLFPFFIKIWNLKMDFGLVTFHHVPREKNREADALVNHALDNEQKTLFGK